MMDGVRSAHGRADWALVGAVSFLVLCGAPLVGVNLYTERSDGPATPASEPVGAVRGSPVELAGARLAAESRCLAEVMYYEARGEGLAGQKAVAEVVLRRTRHKSYAGTVCDVVHEGVQPGRRAGCQFSFACDGSRLRQRDEEAWTEARLLAERIMSGAVRLGNQTGSAIAYHSVDVSPPWSETMLRTARIGNHIFYRFMPRDQLAQAGGRPRAGGQLPPS